MRNVVRIFKTLADESRLRVLNILIERECCVCEVMQVLEISQSKASRMLSALYNVGILKLRKSGLWSLYSVDWDGMDTHLSDIVKATTQAFRDDRVMVLDRERLSKSKRIGPGCVEKMCEKTAPNLATRP